MKLHHIQGLTCVVLFFKFMFLKYIVYLLNIKNMRKLILLTIIILLSCKTETKKNIQTKSNNKEELLIITEIENAEKIKSLNKDFKNIAPSVKSSVKKTISSGNLKYDKLKINYTLIGKWVINNSFLNHKYTFEIYNKGSKYLGIRLNDFTIENLTKKELKYYISGNKYGEFYQVDKNKEMTLFDNDGSLVGAGYTATKIH